MRPTAASVLEFAAAVVFLIMMIAGLVFVVLLR